MARKSGKRSRDSGLGGARVARGKQTGGKTKNRAVSAEPSGKRDGGEFLVVLTRVLSRHDTRAAALSAMRAARLGKTDKIVVIVGEGR